MIIDPTNYMESDSQYVMSSNSILNEYCNHFVDASGQDPCVIKKSDFTISKISEGQKWCKFTSHAHWDNGTCRCDSGYEMINLDYEERKYLCVPTSADDAAKKCWRDGKGYSSSTKSCIESINDMTIRGWDEFNCGAIGGRNSCSCLRTAFGPRCAPQLNPDEYKLVIYTMMGKHATCQDIGGEPYNNTEKWFGIEYNCKLVVDKWYWGTSWIEYAWMPTVEFPEGVGLALNTSNCEGGSCVGYVGFSDAHGTCTNGICTFVLGSESRYSFIKK